MKAKKKIVEKKTGEKYTSKAAMMKHEKSESKAEMKKEYGKPKGPIKQIVDPNAKKDEQNRQNRMTEAEKIRERKQGGRVSTLEPKYSIIRREKKEEPVRGRKERPAGPMRPNGPMQLKSSAKTAPTKMKKC